MKLKTRLKLAFFLIAVMPIVLFSLIIGILLSYQTSNINDYYGIEGANWESFSNPTDILTMVANQIHGDLQEKIERGKCIFAGQWLTIYGKKIFEHDKL